MAKRVKTRAYSAQELCGFGFGEVSGIRKKATREGWKYTEKVYLHNHTKYYAYSSLPPGWQEKIDAKEKADQEALEFAEAMKLHEEQLEKSAVLLLNDGDRETIWDNFARKKNGAKEKAKRKAQAVESLERRIHGEKLNKMEAYKLTAKEFNVSPSTLRKWVKLAGSFAKADRAAVLIDQHPGRTAFADYPEEFWKIIKADFLRNAKPTIASCYERAKRVAEARGWKIPCLKTIENRIKREIPRNVTILMREGVDALEATYPPQQRDVSVFHAMEAVNGDGYQFKVWVDFGNGVIVKPTAWVWQDIRSAKILAWRTDVSENTEVIRLATGDLVEKFGIPEHFYLDNTRAAANKTMTGGVKNRYRFKVKEEDPLGIIPMLGAQVHWSTPGHGQSKPVERAFGIGGLSEYVDKHPAFDGRGTKADPVPLAEFEQILAEEISAWNALTGRRGRVTFGRSFDDIFNDSYSRSVITKATTEQRRLWLLACENVTVNKADASITIQFYNGPQGQNRYWNEVLSRYAGRKITVRFDPADLQKEVHCYTLAGDYIGAAQCIQAAGFNDADAAREHNRQRARYKKAAKEQAKALKGMSAIEAAQMLPKVLVPEVPDSPKVVRGRFNAVHGSGTIPRAVNGDASGELPDEMRRNFERALERMREEQKNRI